MIFQDRIHAGRVLANALSEYSGRSDVSVLALPRGGVPVGFEVARFLKAPLDVFIVRKLGVPGHEELAMGAIASGGIMVLNEDVIRQAHISSSSLEQTARRERLELSRREQAYRAGHAPVEVTDKVCILVDDGIATGASMQAAAKAVRSMHPKLLVIAVPVASPSVFRQFAKVADKVVCVMTPEDFNAVGAWYEHFEQTSDEEVAHYLNIGSFPAQENSRITESDREFWLGP